MGDAHFGVVYDVGEVVSGETVFFDEDDVVTRFWTGVHVTHDFVVPRVGFWIGFEAERDAFVPLGGILGAMITVEIGDFLGVVGLAIFVDYFGRGRVGVGATGGDEFLSPCVIDGFSFGLEVGLVGAANFYTFIPI